MLPQRFWDKVNKTDTCWYWTGAITRFGYPKYRTGQEVTTAYQAMYIDTYGSPPPGLEIDHLCHTRDIACLSARDCMHRRCVNPDHLETVSGVENLKRAHREMPTRCKNGHVRTSENTVVRARGAKPPARECLICRRGRSPAGGHDRNHGPVLDPIRVALFKGFTWGLVIGFLGGMLIIGGLVVGYAWLTGQF